MKKIVMMALFISSSSVAFGSEIMLDGEAGKSVCSLLYAMNIREAQNSRVNYENRLIYTDMDGVTHFEGDAVSCKGYVAKIRGDLGDVRK